MLTYLRQQAQRPGGTAAHADNAVPDNNAAAAAASASLTAMTAAAAAAADVAIAAATATVAAAAAAYVSTNISSHHTVQVASCQLLLPTLDRNSRAYPEGVETHPSDLNQPWLPTLAIHSRQRRRLLHCGRPAHDFLCLRVPTNQWPSC